MARAGDWRRSLRQLLTVAAVLAVVALVGGWLFARGDASAAARLLLREQVESEPVSLEETGPHPERPTSGPHRGTVRCGLADTVPSPEEQVATLAAGVVILHVGPEAAREHPATLRSLVAEHEAVLVVPADDLDAEVVGTAWGHRYRRSSLSEQELERFVIGWVGRGPDPAPCP